MPLLTGLEAMCELTSRSRRVPFVLVTGNPTTVAHWIELGAVAVVDKMDIAVDMAHDLVLAVRAAAAGELYLSRGARARLLPDGSL
jgi:DNA-binding NarL/FixJ family response regulator